jgi:hypothetical protein
MTVEVYIAARIIENPFDGREFMVSLSKLDIIVSVDRWRWVIRGGNLMGGISIVVFFVVLLFFPAMDYTDARLQLSLVSQAAVKWSDIMDVVKDAFKKVT